MATKIIRTCEEYVINELEQVKNELDSTREVLRSKTRALEMLSNELQNIKEALQILGSPVDPIDETDKELDDDTWRMDLSVSIYKWTRDNPTISDAKKIKSFKTLYKYFPKKEEEKKEKD